MNKYNVGDWVRIREDITNLRDLSINTKMRDYIGTIQKVKNFYSKAYLDSEIRFRYRLEGVGDPDWEWTWDESWLDPADDDIDIADEVILALFEEK